MSAHEPRSWQLTDLPGARGQIHDVATDLAAGQNCLWLLPDRMVDEGDADRLYGEALFSLPRVLDLPASPEPADGGGAGGPYEREETSEAGHPRPWTDDDLPYLEGYDDGFDLGWPTATPAGRGMPYAPHDHGPAASLLARIGKELSVEPEQALSRLVVGDNGRQLVVGIRAWAEGDTPAGRGGGIQRLFQTLTAAVKEAGLSPGERPLLFVAARLQDLPGGLPDELGLDVANTSVRWWWGVVGRADTAMVVAPRAAGARRPERRHSDALRDRVVRTVRAEIVVEVSGPDLSLAERLSELWDGKDHSLLGALTSALADVPGPRADVWPRGLAQTGARRKPDAWLREAWAAGAVAAWEGRLRIHPASWHAGPRAQTRARLDALVSQAQQRVVLPWIEDARGRLAARAVAHLTRPVEAVVLDPEFRASRGYLRDDPEQAFLEWEVGQLLSAHIKGYLALPAEDAGLLRLLVSSRNALAHRGVLPDTKLHDLCGELSKADRRRP
ncbi:hypothetical protein [Streptomyces sp. NPDC088762]|uniref:hypothetical protein n=1 Tax=Streptomyces sp. NPDC088762 TaxID=3365891 RepID=UPI0037F12FC0